MKVVISILYVRLGKRIKLNNNICINKKLNMFKSNVFEINQIVSGFKIVLLFWAALFMVVHNLNGKV